MFFRLRSWMRDTWYGWHTTERCQKPVGDSHCKRKHRHPGWHKPYKK